MKLLTNPQQLLRDLLARNPQASLHEIRASHSAFGGMSLDHLSLRLNRLIDSAADNGAK